MDLLISGINQGIPTIVLLLCVIALAKYIAKR